MRLCHTALVAGGNHYRFLACLASHLAAPVELALALLLLNKHLPTVVATATEEVTIIRPLRVDTAASTIGPDATETWVMVAVGGRAGGVD